MWIVLLKNDSEWDATSRAVHASARAHGDAEGRGRRLLCQRANRREPGERNSSCYTNSSYIVSIHEG
jgi:hypothetical protein